MAQTLGIMFTMTTYGTWLRGDKRGWVDKGRTLPPDPWLEAADRQRQKHPVFLFETAELIHVGSLIGQSLRQRLSLRIYALAVRTWHVHAVICTTDHPIENVVKCAKDAVRWGLRPGRPVWTADYDKRFCYDEFALLKRIGYVEQHNVEMGWEPRPWEFVEPFSPR